MDEFDSATHYLGALCVRGHEWNGTGQTLRSLKHKSTGNSCLECGRIRARLSRNGRPERINKSWSKEQILNRIREIELAGEPLNDAYVHKRYSSLYLAARKKRYFDGWGNAVRCAGIDYGDILKVNKFQAIDDELYDSYEEALCANYLHLQGMKYRSHVRICQERLWTCDFVIELSEGVSLYHEYDGCRKLKESSPRTKKILEEKEAYYKASGLSWIVSSTLEEFANNTRPGSRVEKSRVRSIKRDTFRCILREDFERVVDALGYAPTKKEYAELGKFHPETIARHFDGYANMKKRYLYA